MGKGKNYSNIEIKHMLDIVEKFLPTGKYEWDHAADEYNKSLPQDRHRNSDNLKNKFYSLKDATKPTGTGTIAPELARAKDIYKIIESKLCLASFDKPCDILDDPDEDMDKIVSLRKGLEADKQISDILD